MLAPAPAETDDAIPPSGVLPRRAVAGCRPDKSRRLDNFGATDVAGGRSGFSWRCFVASLGAEFIANDKPFLANTRANSVPRIRQLSRDQVRRLFATAADYRDPLPAERDREGRLDGLAADPLLDTTRDTNLAGADPARPRSRRWLLTESCKPVPQRNGRP
jgi:microcin C transport system permease protein